MSKINNIVHKRYLIACDFDGTIVTHRFPEIGELLPGARATIHALQQNGHLVFLYTMRGEKERYRGRNVLQEAIDFLNKNGIELDSYNRSPEQFSDSPKQYAHVYIDDAALGCPMYDYKGEWSVQWSAVAQDLMYKKLIDPSQYEDIINDIKKESL